MTSAPTQSQIEANDRLRKAIYEEQSMDDYEKIERRSEKAEERINNELRDLWLDLMGEIEHRDQQIEELEGKVEALENERADLEVKVESMKAGKAYCNI